MFFFLYFQLDRFIPNRSAMDFDFARYMLTGGAANKEDDEPSSPSKQLYRKHLAEILNINRTRILAFKNKAPPSSKANHLSFSPVRHRKAIRQRRQIHKVSNYEFHVRASNGLQLLILAKFQLLCICCLINSFQKGSWMPLIS